jgi:hypothetical protein
MPIDISARVIGDKELSGALARLSSQDIPKAIRYGVRIAARGGKAAIGKEVSSRYAIGSRRVQRDVSAPTFSEGGLTAILRTSRKPPTAMQFKARETRKGLAFTQIKGERTIIRSGFIAKGLPFRRVGKARMPLSVIHGPSLHAIYTGGRFAGQIQQATEDRIAEQLVNGILQKLSKLGAGYGR